MGEDAYRRLIADARDELRDPQFKMYYKMYGFLAFLPFHSG